MNVSALILSISATIWFTAMATAFFLLGIWLSSMIPPVDLIAYWMFAWVIFGALAAAPVVMYHYLSDL